jgi:HEXXH motif-containing protein
MPFDRSPDAGLWWAYPHGYSEPLEALLRHRANSNVLDLAAIVSMANEIAPSEATDAELEAAFSRLKGVPAPLVSRMARHPSFRYWIVATSHLLRVRSGLEVFDGGMVADGPSTALLILHLRDLHRFGIAARIMAAEEFRDTLVPVHAGPLVFPGTGIALSGIQAQVSVDLKATRGQNGDIALTVEQTGACLHLDPACSAISPTAGNLRRLPMPRIPVVGQAGLEIDVWDPYFRNVWVGQEVFSGGIRAPLALENELEEWTRVMHEAMAWLKLAQGELHDEIGHFIQSVVPIRSLDRSKSLSVSAPEFPGAIQCSLDPAPMMGEVLVHEYRHNLLHAITTLDPVLAPSSPTGDRFYSPWRDDPRPLHGILHAIFSFLGVVLYYRGLLERASLSPTNQRAARRRTTAHAKRLEFAAEQIKMARFTDFGEGFIDGLLRGVTQSTEFARELHGAETQDVIEAVVSHAAARGISL